MGGRVVVWTWLAASAKLLPRAIARVHKARPNVNIVIREGTNDILMPALQTGDVDLVLGRLTEYRHRKHIQQEQLLEEEFCVVGRPEHPLANVDGSATFDQLKAYSWILPPTDTTLRRQLEKEFLDSGYSPPENVVDSVSFLTNRELIKMSDMLCAMPLHVIEEELSNGSLIAINSPINRSLSAVGVSYRRGGGLSPAADVFLQELKLTAAEIDDERSSNLD